MPAGRAPAKQRRKWILCFFFNVFVDLRIARPREKPGKARSPVIVQSTELAEYVRKTVLESKIDTVGKKIEPDKVRVKSSRISPNPGFGRIFRLGGEAARQQRLSRILNGLCDFHENIT